MMFWIGKVPRGAHAPALTAISSSSSSSSSSFSSSASSSESSKHSANLIIKSPNIRGKGQNVKLQVVSAYRPPPSSGQQLGPVRSKDPTNRVELTAGSNSLDISDVFHHHKPSSSKPISGFFRDYWNAMNPKFPEFALIQLLTWTTSADDHNRRPVDVVAIPPLSRAEIGAVFGELLFWLLNGQAVFKTSIQQCNTPHVDYLMRRVELYAKDVSQLASPSAINNLVGSHPCIFLYMHDQQQTLSSRPLKPDVQLHYRVAAEFNKFQPFYKHLIPRLSKEERRIFKLITSAPSNSKSSSTSSLSPPPSYLVDSLVLLCRLLQQSHPQRAKCVVVINGVDHHLHQFNKTHLASQCSELYQAFYRRTFNHNPYLHLGVIIGEESLVHWEKFNVASGSFRIIEETDPIYSSINRYLRVETPWDKQDVFE